MSSKLFSTSLKLWPRTKLTNVTSENMFKDLIAGHARELVNSQTYSMENGGDITQDKHWYYLGQVSGRHYQDRRLI